MASGAACATAIEGASDSIAAVAEQMLGTNEDVSGWDSSGNQDYSDATDYATLGANDLLSGYVQPGESEAVEFSDNGVGEACYSNTDLSGAWGNGDYFLDTAGGYSGDIGNGFQSHFEEVDDGGNVNAYGDSGLGQSLVTLLNHAFAKNLIFPTREDCIVSRDAFPWIDGKSVGASDLTGPGLASGERIRGESVTFGMDGAGPSGHWSG